jgi:hypothetical protein
MPNTITLVDRDGQAHDVPEDQAADLIGRGDFTVETPAMKAARLSGEAREAAYGGVTGGIAATAAGGLRTITGGISDVGFDLVGAGSEARAIRDVNPTASLVGEIAGSVLPIGAGSLAAKAGARLAGTGGGVAKQIARSGVAGVAEGGIQGLGQGVSELALSDKPLDIEHIASTLGSNFFYGGVTGGVAGTAAKGLERGLTRAKAALDDVAARPLGTLGDIPEDLAGLDRKGLRAAETAERETIEAARIPKRAEVADEIKALRNDMKEQKLWLATKDADVKAIKEVREVGKVALEADKAIDRMLRNPKALAQRPQRVLDGLQQQEHALEKLIAQGDNLKPIYAADASGTRQAAFDYASVALERNRAIQAKIADLSAAPASPRLQAIADAAEGLNAPKPQKGMVGELLGGSVFGHVAGAFSGLPVVGPMLGAKAAKMVSGLFEGGKLGTAAQGAAVRGSKAVGAFLDVTRKVQPAAPVIATKVLSSVRYAEQQEERRKSKRDQAPAKAPSLARSFKERSAELRAAVQPAMDGSGKVEARPEVRQRIAKQLAPLAAASPVLADRLETIAARRVTFLASKLPRRPDAFGLQVGPDRWQPSDMEMRTFARYVAAVEDPGAIVERLADGSVTPEDAEAMKSVYPEMFADIQQQILQQLPALRATLPYQRRLAFSVFSGVPVDPALDPAVLTRLQASFEMEEGTQGGTQAPVAQPAFGSVSKQEPTPAQQRGA